MLPEVRELVGVLLTPVDLQGTLRGAVALDGTPAQRHPELVERIAEEYVDRFGARRDFEIAIAGSRLTSEAHDQVVGQQAGLTGERLTRLSDDFRW